MSTRGLVAFENPEDKTCRSIYVHFDMYPVGGGEVLVEFYTTREQIEKLLSLGDLSSLGGKLSYEDNEPNTHEACVAYHRDYGEEYQAPRVWTTAEEMIGNAADIYTAEFVYLFRNGEWVFDTPYHPKGWRSVKQELEKAKEEE